MTTPAQTKLKNSVLRNEVSDKRRTALITGASSGIGRAFAELFAKDGIDVVLVARGTSALQVIKAELEKKYSVTATVMTADLAKLKEVKAMVAALDDAKLDIDYLINNAGFGNRGAFVDTDWEREEEMIELNVVALTYLSKVFGKRMAARGQGRIVNVASTAGFLSGPYMAIYYATKAYVLHFSEAIGYELKEKGVTVTALCPGPTATQFAKAANASGMGIFRSSKLPTAQQVAEYGYGAMNQGKPVATHGVINRIGIWFTRFLPRQVVVKAIGRSQR